MPSSTRRSIRRCRASTTRRRPDRRSIELKRSPGGESRRGFLIWHANRSQFVTGSLQVLDIRRPEIARSHLKCRYHFAFAASYKFLYVAAQVGRTRKDALMTKQSRFASVWDAIEKPKDAASLKARAAVAIALVEEI